MTLDRLVGSQPFDEVTPGPTGPLRDQPWSPEQPRGRRATRRLIQVRRSLKPLISAVAAVGMTVAMAGLGATGASADPSGDPGDPSSPSTSTTAPPVGRTSRSLQRVYVGEAPSGTPIFIYVPSDYTLGEDPSGIQSMDPLKDWNPTDDFTPCADKDAGRLRHHPGADRLPGGRAGEPHPGDRRGALRRGRSGRPDRPRQRRHGHDRLRPARRRHVRLRRDDLHGRLLRTGVHRRGRHERHGHRCLRLGEPDRGPERQPRRPVRALRGRHRPRARAPAAQLQRPRRAVVG